MMELMAKIIPKSFLKLKFSLNKTIPTNAVRHTIPILFIGNILLDSKFDFSNAFSNKK
jgi:hypothetical protein